MSKEQECHFCGRMFAHPCADTRHMADDNRHAPACYAALMMHGGGEYTEDQRLSAELMRRAGLVRKEPRDG